MRKAFTLIELAIVMIIIGILISTILFASEFRRSAEVRATMKQILDYQIAYNNFQDRYESRPGDYKRAYDFWPDSCESEAFCNGNGNGLIDTIKEAHLAWLHLANSGFVPGNFAGKGYGDDDTQKADYNAPYGHLQGTQVSLIYTNIDAFPSTHYLIFGGHKESDLGYTAIITPHHAARIDGKLDDGTPNGMLLGRNGYIDGDWDIAQCIVDESDTHLANTSDLEGASYYENRGDSQECILAFALE
ncbi:MAG: prepilin-type N-terminal cleavage/methylation domain-containing protein [Rickettsiales bacterium]|jgi:prepilin-type N-terminal cleavage/methylation domain-containing protein|nr:prepilin-type N-terminal cleavage/methylation domain-containing protein [Rickettsiales bacterium]